MNDLFVENISLANGSKELIMAGIFTDVSVVFPAIRAVRDKHEVQVVGDDCGSYSKLNDEIAFQRVERVGVILNH